MSRVQEQKQQSEKKVSFNKQDLEYNQGTPQQVRSTNVNSQYTPAKSLNPNQVQIVKDQNANLQNSLLLNSQRQTQLVASNLIMSPNKYQRLQGESRIEYVPYEKTLIEYEPIQKIEYIPKEKKTIEYQPIEYQTEYHPIVYHDKYIEYVPQEKIVERVEYQAVEKKIVHNKLQTSQVVVQQPVQVEQQIVQAPITYVQAPVQYVEAPVQLVEAPVQYVEAPVQYVEAPVNYVIQEQPQYIPLQYVQIQPQNSIYIQDPDQQLYSTYQLRSQGPSKKLQKSFLEKIFDLDFSGDENEEQQQNVKRSVNKQQNNNNYNNFSKQNSDRINENQSYLYKVFDGV